MKQFFHHLYLGVLVCFSFVLSAFGAAWPDGQVIGMPMKLTNSSNVYYSNNVKTFDQFSVTRYMLNSRSYQNGTNDYPENYAYYMTIKKGGTYTFTGSMQGSIIVDTTEPVTLILDNVNIQAYNTKFSSVFKPNDSAYYQLRAAISIENNSQVTILLKGSNSLKGYDDGSSGFANTMMSSAGIYVENTYSNYTQWNRKQRLASVTIEDYPDDNAVGSLYAKGGFQSAGIGGQANRLAGNITINSGDIHAVGGDWGCGIGDGDVFRTKGANTADNDYVCDVEQREYSREGLVKGTNDKNTYQSYYEVGYNTSYAEIVINSGTIFGEATTDTPGIGTADELPSRWRAINYGKSNGYGALWGGKKIILNAGVVVALSGKTAQTHSTAFGPGASTVLPAANLIINQCSYTENTDGSVTTNWTYMVACTRTSSMSYAASNQGGFVVPAISDLSTATVWNMALNPETHVGKNLDFFALSGASLDNLIWPEFPNNYLHDRTVFGDKMIAGISVVMPYLYGYVITDGSNTVITGYAGGPGANNQWEGGDLHRPPVVTPPSDEYVFTGGAATFTVTGVAREGGNKLTFTWYRTNDGGKTWESVQTETRSVSKGTASSTYTQTGVTEAMEGTSRYFCVAVEKGTDGVSRTGVSGTATIYVPEMVVKTNIEMDPEAILLNQEPTAAQVTLKVASVGAKGQVGAYQSLTKMFDNGIQDTQLIKVNTADDSLLTGALSVPSFTVDKVVVGEGKIYDIKISKLTLTSTEDRWYWIAKSVDADTWYYPSYWGKEEKSLSRAQAAGEAYKSYHPDVDVPVETNYTHSVLTYKTNLNNTVTYPIYGFVTNAYNYTMRVDSLTYGSTTVPAPTDGSNVYTVPDNRGQVKASDVTDTAWDDAHMPGNNDAAVAYDFANDRADGQLKVVLTSNNLPPEISDPQNVTLPANSLVPADFSAVGTAKEGAAELAFDWYMTVPGGQEVKVKTEVVKVDEDGNATTAYSIWPETAGWKTGTTVRAVVTETSPKDSIDRTDASETAKLTLTSASSGEPPQVSDPSDVYAIEGETATFAVIGVPGGKATSLDFVWYQSTDGGETWEAAARTTGAVDSTTGAARSTLTLTGVTDRNDETLYHAIVIEGSGSDAKMAGSKNAELFVPEIEVIPNVVLDSSLPVELRPTGARVAISVVTTNAAGQVVKPSLDIAAAFGEAFIAAGASAYTYDEATKSYYLDLAFGESGKLLTGSLALPAYTVTRTPSGTGSISEHEYGTSNVVDVVRFKTGWGGDDGTINQYTARNQWGQWITYNFPSCFGSGKAGYLKAKEAGWAKTSYGDVQQKTVYMTNDVKQVEYVIRDVEVSYPKYAYTTNYLAYAFETVALNYGDVGGTANWVALDADRVFQPYDNPMGAMLSEPEAVSLTSLSVSLGEGDRDVAWDPATDKADGQLKEVLTGYVNPNIPPIMPGDPTKQPPTGPEYGRDPASGDNINDPEDPYHPGYVITNDPEDPWLVVPDPLNPTTTDPNGNVATNWVAGTPGVEQPFVEKDGKKVYNEMRVVIDVVGPGTLTWRDLVRDPSTQQDATLVVTVDGGEPVTVYVGNRNVWNAQSLVFGGDMDTAHQVVITFQGNSSGNLVRQAHGYVDDIIWTPYVDAKYEDVKAPDSELFTFANLGTDPTAATHHVGVTIHNGTNVVTTSTVNGDGKQLTSTVAGKGVTWESTTTTGTEDLWYAIQDPGPSNYVNNTIAQTAPTLSAKEVAEMTVTGLDGPSKFYWDMKIADDATNEVSKLEVIVTRHVIDANGNELDGPMTYTYTYAAAEIADWTHGWVPLSGPWSESSTMYEVTFRYTNNGDGTGVCSIDNIKRVRPDINIAPELHDAGPQPPNGSEYGADEKKRPDPNSKQNVNNPNDPYYPQYTVTNDDIHPWEVVPDPKAGTPEASDPGKANDDVAQTPNSLRPGDESKVVVKVRGDGEFSWKSRFDIDKMIRPNHAKERLPRVVGLVDGKTNTVYTSEEKWTKHTVHVVDAIGHDNATHTIEIVYVQGGAEDGSKAASTGSFDNFNWQRSAIQREMEELVVTESPSGSENEARSKVCITNEYQSGWMPVYETKTNDDGSTTTTTIGVRSADGSEGVPDDKTEDKLHSEFDVYVKGTGELMIERITFPAYDPANGIKTDDNGRFTIKITDSWDDDNDPATPDKTETKDFVLPEPGSSKCPANYSVTTNENGIVTVENLVIWVYGEPNVNHNVKFVDERTAESSTENSATVVEHITWCTLLQAKALWIIDHEDSDTGEVFLAFEPELKVEEEVDAWVRRCAQAQMIRVKCGRSRAEAEASAPLVATLCDDKLHPIRAGKVWIKVRLADKNQKDISANSYWRIYVNGPAIALNEEEGTQEAREQKANGGLQAVVSPLTGSKFLLKAANAERPVINDDGAESPNTFGILQVNSTTTNTLIAVPWTWYSKYEKNAQDIPVSKLVKTTNLTEGDQLFYYSKREGTYYVWTVDEEGEWKADVTVTVGTDDVSGVVDLKQANGIIEYKYDDETKPIEQQMSVARGLGMWLVRQRPVDDKGNAIPFWVYGQSVATKVVTPIEAPSANLLGSDVNISMKVVCNILGNPYATEVEINKLQFVDDNGNSVVPDENDRIWIPNGTTAGTYVIYRDHDGKPETPMCWYYTQSKVEGSNRVTEYITDVRVPGGLGFWYDRRGKSAMKIVWPVPTEDQSSAVDVPDGTK